ncbi:nickel/cobalt efflux transporter [Methylobacterium sp. NFXW15]|uniref:nickel/cobalt efflux transporter n=1 Tax=Methylobacterium sp. NFXW15 TaxID=2819512 RepID=UPI003CE697E8
MTSLPELLQQGTAHAWLFVPTAILLGVLHGLEPGHSKTMMAAFIIAVRGTVTQAVLLGLAATLSHTAVVWVIALAGQYFGQSLGEGAEPYFQLASAVLIVSIAAWMAWQTWREQHHHHHDHHHHHHHHDDDHAHDHAHLDLGDEDDAHARAHADDIRRRFSGRSVTTGEIVMFGLTGGLIPCPAAITVLLLCIQLKQFSLGFALVLCFSIGLALTMVSAGVLAALSVKHVATRWSGFGTFARRAPYASSALIVLVGLYTGWLGWEGIRNGESAHKTLSAVMPPS